MTDERNPLEVALDVMIYAPIGLALAVSEEVPKLAAKGRSALEGQQGAARAVGQLVVARGRSEIKKRISNGNAGTGRMAVGEVRPGGNANGTRTDTTRPKAGREANGDEGEVVVNTADISTGDRAAPAVESLAIPGYDSLSASQVVQRLAGLASDQLEAVGDYEATTRGRRTILTRVSQLRSR